MSHPPPALATPGRVARRALEGASIVTTAAPSLQIRHRPLIKRRSMFEWYSTSARGCKASRTTALRRPSTPVNTRASSDDDQVAGSAAPEELDVLGELVGKSLDSLAARPRDVRRQDEVRQGQRAHERMIGVRRFGCHHIEP